VRTRRDKRQGLARKQRSQVLQQHITVSSFPAVYRTLAGLRFPADVEDVIEIRDMINQSLDRAERSAIAPRLSQLDNTFTSAIEQSGIHRQHHAEKLARILVLFRELHFQHTLMSRNREIQIRQLMADNREARASSTRLGMISIISASISFISLLALPEPSWLIKSTTLVFAIAALDYFQSLHIFDREYGILTSELNGVLRDRVGAMNRTTLARNLAAVLGYSKHGDAFLIQTGIDGFGNSVRDKLPGSINGYWNQG